MTDRRGFQRQAPASARDSLAIWFVQTILRPRATARLAETTFSLTPSLLIPAPLSPSPSGSSLSKTPAPESLPQAPRPEDQPHVGHVPCAARRRLS